MPKRVGRLYEKMLDRELIKRVILDGTKHKRKRRDVQMVLADIDSYVNRLHEILSTNSYTPSTPKETTIIDKSSGKERTIAVMPYWPDGLIQQIVVEVMRPCLMRNMYRWSCASIPGRGNSDARRYIKRALSRDPKGTKYCLKMDIRQFYPSIDRTKALYPLIRKIKDVRFLKLIWTIINNNPGPGLAIGYYLNQWLANLYLEQLDWIIKGMRGINYYIRNMDDMVLLGSSKRLLHKACTFIGYYLEGQLGLELKSNWQVFPVSSRGIDFVGYRFYHDRITLRRRNFRKLRNQCLRMAKCQNPTLKNVRGVISRIGQLSHCNSYEVKQKYVDPLDVDRLKKLIALNQSARSHARIKPHKPPLKPQNGSGRDLHNANSKIHN